MGSGRGGASVAAGPAVEEDERDAGEAGDGEQQVRGHRVPDGQYRGRHHRPTNEAPMHALGYGDAEDTALVTV